MEKDRVKTVRIPPAHVLGDPICMLAFGFGSGLSPIAPGTAGTLAAVPLYWLTSSLSLPTYLVLTLVLLLAGIWICGRCEQILGVGDHSGIVWDEMVGFLIAMAGAPVSPLTLILGFILFRLFDVMKPWPIGILDRRIQGGLGIMLDDVLAGAYAWMALALLMDFGLI